MPERSHYEVLGVAPGAEPDTVRRAYLRQARRWHPDRPSGDPERMRAINRAWQTLGDPRSRAEYDRTLSRPASVPPASGSPRPGRSSGPVSNPRPSGGRPAGGRPAGDHPADGPSEPWVPLEMIGIRRRWIGLAVAAMVAAAIALILVATSNTDDPGPAGSISPPAPVSRSRPEPGDCFWIGIATIVPVPCDHPHDGKLVSWVTLGAPCPPRTESRWVRAVQQVACYHPPTG
ncbi:J domain-containing protein [Candidatus Poriferisocius sp.]|uniref:J domain-containing protein n=1 Tax=Candidatus Poriferisocius sp. TaxID=3101276 RepID=UPI003B01D0A9